MRTTIQRRATTYYIGPQCPGFEERSNHVVADVTTDLKPLGCRSNSRVERFPKHDEYVKSMCVGS